MAEFPDALIEQAAQALSNHILGPKWVCICGFECWQPDAGNGNQCATASYGVHRQHIARAVLADVSDELTEGIRTAVARIDIHSPHTSLCRLLDDLHTLIGSPTVEEPPC